MRFDEVVDFIKVKNSYNPDTSEDVLSITSSITIGANVYDLGAEEELKLFNQITNEHKSVVILGEFSGSFDYIIINNDFYKLNSTRKFGNKTYYLVQLTKEVFNL